MSAANDNPEPLVKTITFAELAAALNIDEDTLLQRFARTLVARDASDGDAPCS